MAEGGTALSMEEEDPGPLSVGMLEDKLVGVLLLGAVGLRSCWRGVGEGLAGWSDWLVG